MPTQQRDDDVLLGASGNVLRDAGVAPGIPVLRLFDVDLLAIVHEHVLVVADDPAVLKAGFQDRYHATPCLSWVQQRLL